MIGSSHRRWSRVTLQGCRGRKYSASCRFSRRIGPLVGCRWMCDVKRHVAYKDRYVTILDGLCNNIELALRLLNVQRYGPKLSTRQHFGNILDALSVSDPAQDQAFTVSASILATGVTLYLSAQESAEPLAAIDHLEIGGQLVCLAPAAHSYHPVALKWDRELSMCLSSRNRGEAENAGKFGRHGHSETDETCRTACFTRHTCSKKL
jgi:hypothetical protein